MTNNKTIYSNCFGKLSQNSLLSNYEVTFFNQSYSLSPKELRLFLKQFKSLDIAHYLNSSSDLEVIFLPELDILFTLSITEIIYLKDLVVGSICMLELNSILETTLSSPL